jgi:hypothetical protein
MFSTINKHKELSQRLNTAYISYKNKFAVLKGALKMLGGGLNDCEVG